MELDTTDRRCPEHCTAGLHAPPPARCPPASGGRSFAPMSAGFCHACGVTTGGAALLLRRARHRQTTPGSFDAHLGVGVRVEPPRIPGRPAGGGAGLTLSQARRTLSHGGYEHDRVPLTASFLRTTL